MGVKKAGICLPVGRQVYLLAVWKTKFETLTNKEYNRARQPCGFYCFFRADLPCFISSLFFIICIKAVWRRLSRIKFGQDIHILWEQLKMNGKETSKESFEKYTGLMFLKQLKKSGDKLSDYTTEQKDRNYIFRQRDPLAILITSRIMAGEKLDYIHYNLPAGRLVLFNPIGNCAKIQLSTGFLQQCFMKQAMMNLRY